MRTSSDPVVTSLLGLPSVAMASCVLALLTAGCGSGSPFSYVQVEGRVTYADGTLAPEGLRVVFASQTEPVKGQHPRVGNAYIGPDGKIGAITSYKPDDGLVRGKHKVLLIYEGPNADSVVPRVYRKKSTTPLEIDTADSPFELTIE